MTRSGRRRDRDGTPGLHRRDDAAAGRLGHPPRRHVDGAIPAVPVVAQPPRPTAVARDRAERERQWALQQQVWEMERQIWDEQLSDEEREARRQARERAAEVRREARRRLGLPEEEKPS
jgi:hypothetical protein